MSGFHHVTLAVATDLPKLLKGDFIHGRGEPRIAMAGRSNVGKSSLINSLVGFKEARTSATPGKTREIHFYVWKEPGIMIADMPGYGFAKGASADRQRWNEVIQLYMDSDPKLMRVLVLLDARNGPTRTDEEAIRFLSFKNIPVTFVFTKADKLKTQSERARRRKETTEALNRLGVDPEAVFWTSTSTGAGLGELKKHITSF